MILADRLYTSAPDCMRKVFKNEGIGAFYRGALSNVYRGTGAALVLAMYDELQYLLKL